MATAVAVPHTVLVASVTQTSTSSFGGSWLRSPRFQFSTARTNSGPRGIRCMKVEPARGQGMLYPNETMADFAFLPFGGGPRKCVGDQFALMESTVGLTMLLQKFDIELRGTPEEVELVTGATIHTKDGLWCKLRRRNSSAS